MRYVCSLVLLMGCWLSPVFVQASDFENADSSVRFSLTEPVDTTLAINKPVFYLDSTLEQIFAKTRFADSEVAHFTAANTENLKSADTGTAGPLDLEAGLTISAWVRLDSIGAATTIVGKWNTTGNQRAYLLQSGSSENVAWHVSNDGTADVVESTQAGDLVTTGWVHVLARHSNGVDLRVYINGGTPETTTHTTGIFDSTADFFIGGFNDGTSGPFDGKIRDVGIWSRAFVTADIVEAFNDGVPLDYNNLSTAMKVGLVSYWNLDEESDGSGAITRVDSHGSNNLTDINTTPSATITDNLSVKVRPVVTY
jgi:hypothetical protein